MTTARLLTVLLMLTGSTAGAQAPSQPTDAPFEPAGPPPVAFSPDSAVPPMPEHLQASSPPGRGYVVTYELLCGTIAAYGVGTGWLLVASSVLDAVGLSTRGESYLYVSWALVPPVGAAGGAFLAGQMESGFDRSPWGAAVGAYVGNAVAMGVMARMRSVSADKNLFHSGGWQALFFAAPLVSGVGAVAGLELTRKAERRAPLTLGTSLSGVLERDGTVTPVPVLAGRF